MNQQNQQFSNYQQVLLKKFVLICFSMIYLVDNLCSQELSWDYYLEKLGQEDFYEQAISEEEMYDLYTIREHPFNINAVTKNDLERLVFLESVQIEDILAYLYQYGPMKSLGELLFIESLDYDTREFLKFFFYVDDNPVEKSSFTLKNLLKEGRYSFTTRLDIPLYQRDGYKNYPDSVLLKTPDKKYLGNALYHYIKLQYDYRNRLYWGLTAVKDAGEPFANNLNKGYDSYSFHLLLKNWAFFETIALGDYRVRTGEGLVFGSGFSMGKEFDITMSRQVINKHTSTDEYYFMRGAAATMKWGDLCFSPFVSFRKMDASLNENGRIETLKTDGYHRTWTEYFRKRNVFNGLYGAHLSYNRPHYKVGMTGYYQHWDHEFSTGTQLYKHYAPKGRAFWGLSVDYGVAFGDWAFSGESAHSGLYHGWATVNKLLYRPLPDLKLFALYRLYSYRYYAQYASAFSEGSKTQNESGFYFGVEYQPWRFVQLKAAFDYYYFPWPKYGLDHSSDGYQIRLQSDIRQNDRMRYSATYSFKKKEKFNVFHYTHRLRLKYIYQPDERMVLQTECSGVGANKTGGKRKYGALVGESFSWVINNLLKTTLTCAYIHADGSLCSLSLYEPGLLYSFSFNNYYDPVLRLSGMLRLDLGPRYLLLFKYGMSRYFGVSEISSGRQRISGSLKQDLYLQLRVKI